MWITWVLRLAPRCFRSTGGNHMEADLVYYRRRSDEEAKAARRALDPRVRDVHLALADGYAQRVLELEKRRADVHLTLVTAA